VGEARKLRLSSERPAQGCAANAVFRTTKACRWTRSDCRLRCNEKHMMDLDTPSPETSVDPGADSPLCGVSIRWSPVVGRDERPIGFRLGMLGRPPGVSLAQLLDAVLAGFTDESSGMPQGLVLLAPQDVGPDESLGFWGAPRNVLLEIDEQALDSPAGRERVALAQKHGVRLALSSAGPMWPSAD
jgi:hypothetical protein